MVTGSGGNLIIGRETGSEVVNKDKQLKNKLCLLSPV